MNKRLIFLLAMSCFSFNAWGMDRQKQLTPEQEQRVISDLTNTFGLSALKLDSDHYCEIQDFIKATEDKNAVSGFNTENGYNRRLLDDIVEFQKKHAQPITPGTEVNYLNAEENFWMKHNWGQIYVDSDINTFFGNCNIVNKIAPDNVRISIPLLVGAVVDYCPSTMQKYWAENSSWRERLSTFLSTFAFWNWNKNKTAAGEGQKTAVKGKTAEAKKSFFSKKVLVGGGIIALGGIVALYNFRDVLAGKMSDILPNFNAH